MIVLFYLFALTLAGGYKKETGDMQKAPAKWRNWKWDDSCAAGNADCVMAGTDGVFKFNKDHFEAAPLNQSEWSSNTMFPRGGDVIEMTFDINGLANFYLKSGNLQNKTLTYKLIIPENGNHYGINFQDNDGKLNDVSVKFLKSTSANSQPSLLYMKGGSYWTNDVRHDYTNKINYLISYEANQGETIYDFTKYKIPVWQESKSFNLKFDNVPFEENEDLKTNIGIDGSLNYSPTIGTIPEPNPSTSGPTYSEKTIDGLWYKVVNVKKEAPIGCEGSYGTQFKYMIHEDKGLIDVYEIGKCAQIDGVQKKVSVCSDKYYQLQTCNHDGSFGSSEYKKFRVTGFKQITENELPSHVVQEVVYSENNCPANKETGTKKLYTNSCLRDQEEKTKEQYFKISQNGVKITKKYFKNNTCTEAAEKTDLVIDCNSCKDKAKVVCSVEGITCEANYQKDSKYIILENDGSFFTVSIGECFDLKFLGIEELRLFGNGKLTPCSGKVVSIEGCSGNESNKKKFDMQKYNVEFTKEIPAHIAHSLGYSDNNCGTQVKGIMVLYKNKCVKRTGTDYKSSLSLIDGKNFVEKLYSDENCKTPYSKTQETTACDKCDGSKKLMCYEYGKKPDPAKTNNGAFSTFILIAVAMVFFLF